MRFVISAAGMGGRLGMDIPKCLLPIGDARLIDYQLALLPPGSDIRIVIGFKEHEVMEHVALRWPDVTFVRNPAFATTSNTHSLHLASRYIAGTFISIDGDLIIAPDGFARFLAHCYGASDSVIGVAPRASQEAVGVALADGHVTRFLRPGTAGLEECRFEWCGIAYVNGITLTPNRRYVFEELAQHLPLPAFEIPCIEIDTPSDLANALQALEQGQITMPTLPCSRR